MMRSHLCVASRRRTRWQARETLRSAHPSAHELDTTRADARDPDDVHDQRRSSRPRTILDRRAHGGRTQKISECKRHCHKMMSARLVDSVVRPLCDFYSGVRDERIHFSCTRDLYATQKAFLFARRRRRRRPDDRFIIQMTRIGDTRAGRDG